MNTEVIAVERNIPQNFYQMGPESKVVHAAAIAKELKKIIDSQGMFAVIGKSKHVTCEGWTTALALLGIVPREKSVIRHPDGTYEASVDLVNFATGTIVGGASAICGMDEKTWADRPEYARRSMSITRATGKAARLAYSWIIKLAGYSPTPSEEMIPDATYIGDPVQKAWLAELMSSTKIDKDQWVKYHEAMIGRPLCDFDSVFTHISKEVVHAG